MVYHRVFRGRGGEAVVCKRVQRGDHGKLIPVNMGGEGKGVIEYYRALWKDQVSFKLRKHFV